MNIKKIIKQIKKQISGLFVSGKLGAIYSVVSFNNYMKSKQQYLEQIGINIDRNLRFVACDVYFDGHDYSLIHLGKDIIISREVMILTHDYSLGAACRSMEIAIKEGAKETPHSTGIVSVGEHSFIGARASLLPNTVIGKGCIIGACSVVKGNVPDFSIVVGNPGKIVGDTREWADRKLRRDE